MLKLSCLRVNNYLNIGVGLRPKGPPAGRRRRRPPQKPGGVCEGEAPQLEGGARGDGGQRACRWPSDPGLYHCGLRGGRGATRGREGPHILQILSLHKDILLG